MKKTVLLLAAALCIGSSLNVLAGDAKEVYDKQCAKCHGEDGKGQTKMGEKLGCRDYSSAAVQSELKDDAAFNAIKDGLKKDGKSVMKPAQGVSDEEIKGLVAHMRSFKK
jgi:cytochrome c553